jgi:hypothetical protein
MPFPLDMSRARGVTVTLVFAALLVAVGTASAQGVPGTAANKCLAGKTKCVSTKIAGLLKCRAKCQANPHACGQPLTDCETKVIAKFDGGADPTKGCFAKLEAKADPSKPESVCTNIGDSATVETQADALVTALLTTLETPVCPCGEVTGKENGVLVLSFATTPDGHGVVTTNAGGCGSELTVSVIQQGADQFACNASPANTAPCYGFVGWTALASGFNTAHANACIDELQATFTSLSFAHF